VTANQIRDSNLRWDLLKLKLPTDVLGFRNPHSRLFPKSLDFQAKNARFRAFRKELFVDRSIEGTPHIGAMP
jgi:hypothetical protein